MTINLRPTSPDSALLQRDAAGWRAALPVALMLLVSTALYVWMAPRGFECTDESHYLLSYLYWRDSISLLSFFAVYLEWPFRLLGQSWPNMRLLTLMLLFVSSIYFSRELYKYVNRRGGGNTDATWLFVLVGMCASMYYFNFFGTLRAPSYNLVVLVTMLVSTALLLRLLTHYDSSLNTYFLMVCYGITIGACGLSKATAGLLLVVIHLVYFAFNNLNWRVRFLFQIFCLTLAGVCLNVALLQWTHPRWLDALQSGLVDATADNGSHGLSYMLNGFRWQFQGILPKLIPWALAGFVLLFLIRRYLTVLHRSIISIFTILIISVCIYVLTNYDLIKLRLPLLDLAILMLWSLKCVVAKAGGWVELAKRDLGLMAMLIVLPYAYSFGTDTGILKHSQMAAIFPVIAIVLLLFDLAKTQHFTRTGLIACLSLLCLPPLVAQARTITDSEFTYRQLSALGEQTHPLRIGPANNVLLVDAVTSKDWQLLISTAKAAGLESNQSMLDFTDVGPGLTYALEGRPLGTTWLIGGYQNSHANAVRLVNGLPKESIRKAWILSSDNNPGAIKDWDQQVKSKLGITSHELVGSTDIHVQSPNIREHSPIKITVKIWKPLDNGEIMNQDKL